MNLSKIWVLCLLSAPLFAQTESITIPLSNPGKPGALEVGLIRGSIHVSSHAGKDIVIEAVAVEGGKESRKSETVNGMKRLSAAGGSIDLKATEDKNKVVVSNGWTKTPVNLTIKVPQQFSLKLNAINEGDIIVNGVQGDHELTNINGPITLNNVAGAASVNTINGDVKATFRSITDSPMAFSSMNGSIDVTFPPASKFDVKVKSDRGEIFTDFEVAVQKAASKGTTSSEKGLYKITKEDWVQGKVNGGGGEVMMKNMNGNIYIRKSK